MNAMPIKKLENAVTLKLVREGLIVFTFCTNQKPQINGIIVKLIGHVTKSVTCNISKGGFFSESAMCLSNLQKRYSKSLS